MFAYGWPKALNTGATPLDHEAIYCCQTSGEYVIAVFTATVQVWSSGQHRLKLGELHRTREQVEEEGANVRAHWCPQKRVLAVAVSGGRRRGLGASWRRWLLQFIGGQACIASSTSADMRRHRRPAQVAPSCPRSHPPYALPPAPPLLLPPCRRHATTCSCTRSTSPARPCGACPVDKTSAA